MSVSTDWVNESFRGAIGKFWPAAAARYPSAVFSGEFSFWDDAQTFTLTLECEVAGRVGKWPIPSAELLAALTEADVLEVLLAALHRAWLAAGGGLPERRFRFQRHNPKHLSAKGASVRGREQGDPMKQKPHEPAAQRNHYGDCAPDSALTAAGFPDQQSRDAARALLAEKP